MFPDHDQPLPEDPSVASVEQILQTAASRSVDGPRRRDGRLVVTHAVWLCACETMDDSPLWLIYAVGEHGLGWQRVPDGTDLADVVDAGHLTGGHSSPHSVLAWLRGDRSDPCDGHGDAPHVFVVDELRRRVRPHPGA